MKENFNDTATQCLQADRKPDTQLLTVDLLSFIEQIRNEELHKDADTLRHTAGSLMSVQILEGQMQFITDEQSISLGKGHILVLKEDIPYSVFADEKTIFMLTLTNNPVRIIRAIKQN